VKVNPVIRVLVLTLEVSEMCELPVMVAVPPPFTVIPFVLGTVTVPPPHEQVPPGTTTVSPLTAELTAFCTSVCEQEAAVMVLARAGRHQNKASEMMICTFTGDHLRAPQDELIVGNWSPRLLPIMGFPCPNFCPELSSVPRTLILRVPPTPTPYSVGLRKA